MAGSAPEAIEPVRDPVERQLASLADIAEGIDAIIERADERLRVFDVDFAQGGWSTAVRADRLAAFMRRVRHARVDIVLHDTRVLEQSCPRLVALLKTYGHAIKVYRTGPEARHAMDPLVIADDRHHLHRFHVDHARAVLAFDAPLATQPLALRFDEIWATGEPGLSGTVLGL